MAQKKNSTFNFQDDFTLMQRKSVSKPDGGLIEKFTNKKEKE